MARSDVAVSAEWSESNLGKYGSLVGAPIELGS